ncbi:hypothetical protein AGR4A_Cc50167 [Agrobacterium tumefaciens str. B6]|uniref:Uncharacterized protein n=1 Tax=Agrobacterium tumefaciens str. B6 TaxID=1183423 RepID=A0A822V3B2_AGRTU|nr:hypothetical protein AGR4A_Cc50167 [Agrobacterium tumefaciens str. B6]
MSLICDGSYFPPPDSDSFAGIGRCGEPHAAARFTGEKLNRDILRIGNGTRFVLISLMIQISLEAAPDERR